MHFIPPEADSFKPDASADGISSKMHFLSRSLQRLKSQTSC